jgi:hypothetical protein
MSIKEEIILHTINLENPALLADLLAYVQHLQNIDQAQLSQVPVRKFNMLTAAQIKSLSYV